MAFIDRPLDNSVGTDMTLREGCDLINDNFEVLGDDSVGAMRKISSVQQTIDAVSDQVLVTPQSLGGASSTANEVNKLVKRDSNGNFSANVITATLNGDADTLDGKHASDLIQDFTDILNYYAIGATTLTVFPSATIDDNTVATGIYEAYSKDTLPAGVANTNGWLININRNNGLNVFQMYLPINGDKNYWRYYREVEGGWQEWRHLMDSGNGATAQDSLDGVESGKWISPEGVSSFVTQFGIGTSNSSTVSDVDAIEKTGVYRTLDTTANTPKAKHGVILHIARYSASTVIRCSQMLTDADGETYVRYNISNAWTPWELVFTSNSGRARTAEVQGGSDVQRWVSPADIKAYVDQFGLGISDDTLTGISDPNLVTATGFYRVQNNASNIPIYEYGVLLHVTRLSTSGALRYVQKFFTAGGEEYIRYHRSGYWNDWSLEFSSGSGAATEAQALAGTEKHRWMSPENVKKYTDQYGLGVDYNASNLPTVDDLDEARTSGIFGFSAGATSNPGSIDGVVIVSATGDNRPVQIVVSREQSYFYRVATSLDGLTWGIWRELAEQSYVDNKFTGSTYVDNIVFRNPGVGNSSKLTFTKGSDQAWIEVNEVKNDSTEFSFNMADNPDASDDKFFWKIKSWQGAHANWVPLKFAGLKASITAATTDVASKVNIYESPFYSNDGVIGEYGMLNDAPSLVDLDVSGFNLSARRIILRVNASLDIDVYVNRGVSETTITNYTPDATITPDGTSQHLIYNIYATFPTTGLAETMKWAFQAYSGGGILADGVHRHWHEGNDGSGSGLDADTVDGMEASDFVAVTEKGAANGVATLNSSGIIPASQLPAYVDDVVEYADLASFPATGETGKIYVALDTNNTYRWSGSTYSLISSMDLATTSKAGIVELATLAEAIAATAGVVPDAANSLEIVKSWVTKANIDALNIDAAKLKTAVTINGVSFDGSSNITVQDSTKLPTAGGTVTGNLVVNGKITSGSAGFKIGEGLDIISDPIYFDGVYEDARIFRMIDANGTNGNVDGGLVIEGYTNSDGVSVELLRLRSNGQFQFKGNNIFHEGNGASTAEARAGAINNKWMSPADVKAYVDQFGLGLTTNTTITSDVDSLSKSGVYYMNSTAPNLPIAEFGIVEVNVSNTTNGVFHRYTSIESGVMYVRRKLSGTWSAWGEIATTDSVASLVSSEVAAGIADIDGLLYRGFTNDANTALTNGQYGFAGTSLVNYPYTTGYGRLMVYVSTGDVHNNSNNWIWQVILDTSGNCYRRNKVNSSGWTSWVKTEDINGATNAIKLRTARTISLTGDVTGSASFDGSANASITATVGNNSHTHSSSTITSITPTVAASATAGLSTGRLGTYAYLRHASAGTTITKGGVYSGSILRYSGITTLLSSDGNQLGNYDGDISPTGSWLAMGTCASTSSSRYNSTLFLRIV